MRSVSKSLVKIVIACILVFSVIAGFGGSQEAEALTLSKEDKAKIVKTANATAKKYGFTPIDPKKVKYPKGTKQLNFKSVKEFEAYMKKQNTLKGEQVALASVSAISSTKTYKYTEYNGTGKITSYARVKRTSGKVKSVNVWSEQTGVIFALNWDEKTTWHKLNSKKTGGNAYVRGVKLYGMNVVGQPVGYSKSVTYKVKF